MRSTSLPSRSTSRAMSASLPPPPAPPAAGARRVTGSVLVGRWPAATPPPWALGDSELILGVEDDGGEVVVADGASLVARFDRAGQALAAAVAVQRTIYARGGPLG